MHTARCWSGLSLLLVLVLTSGCGARQGSASTLEERVNLYKTLSNQVKADAAAALKPLNKLAKDEASNAIPHYLLAAADAKLGKWMDALQEVEVGNGAKSCAYPVTEAVPYQNYLGFVVLRQFVKDAPTSTLDSNTQIRLCRALRDMGGRIATGEPRNMAVLTIGAGFRQQASHIFADVLQRNGRGSEADQARSVEAADAKWRQAIKQVTEETYKKGGVLDADKLTAKYGFTPAEAKEYDTAQTPSPSAREKMLKMSAEMNETERTLSEKLLKDMPR